ncbi:MAG: hypothetical protein U9N43_05405 [Euryarchaeota archaeon]|nr:hypothetical protein [Euryarchaeota archaeon]
MLKIVESLVNSTILLMYPPSGDYFPDGSPCNVWDGGVWLTPGNQSKSAVLIIGRKGRGHPYYGGPRPGDCRDSKEYHCGAYETQFLFYNTDKLSEVARSEREYCNSTLYTISRPKEHFLPSCSGSVGGAAADVVSGRCAVDAYESGWRSEIGMQITTSVYVRKLLDGMM